MAQTTPHLGTSPAAGLQWVRVEIEQSLTRARGLIQQYLDSPENLQPLQQAAIELHLVNGSAGVVQCHGIVALSEEMAQLLQTLQQGKIVERDAAFSALLGATLQLSDYVDILADSRTDCALALLPVINELRLAQGKGVRSEAELVAAEMLFLGVRPDPPPMHAADGSVLATARQLLPLYQASLLRWLKLNDTQALLKIGKIAAQISKEASIAIVHELWRGAAACAEAVLTRTLDDSQDIRRLYGRVMQQLQVLAGSGEDAAAEKSGDLVYHFVFHLGRSHANSTRANSIRADYSVARLVPSREFVEEFRHRLRGPNTLLLNRLAAEIRQDLSQAKDRIDLIVRTGSRDSAALQAITTGLTRVANTLSVLGLSNLQHVVSSQVQVLQALAAESAPTDRWMEVAVALLRIEQGLEGALYRQLRHQASIQADPEQPGPQGSDLQESVAALLREALVDLARLKAAVDGYLRGASAESLSEAGRSLGQIASSLRVLEDARAAELSGQLLDSMSGPSFPDRCRDPEWAAAFADSVILIEIYLEALRDRRPDSPDILQSLAQRIAALQAPEPGAQPLPVAAVEVAAPAAEMHPAVDEEIRDIFVEEAAEVRAALIARLPALRRDSQDRNNLQEMRRGFHTLKGSGRMVGATDIGEFAWAVESLLNRCLDGSIQVSPPVVDAINQAVSQLEPMLQSFAAGTAGPQTKTFIDRVQHLASGKLLDTQAETELLAVFREDANERLEEIRGWLGRQADGASEYEVNEVVRRAFHTLRGSAAIVGLKPVSQLAGSIEAYLDALRSGALKLPAAAMVLLRDACDAIAGWVDAGSVEADLAPWQLRIQQLQQVVPQEAQHAAAEHGLADVFASEALDLLQSIESGIRDWARTPESHEQPRILKRVYQTLHGAALMANCEALASPARAFELVVGEFADAGTIPDEHFFARLSALQEKMYQQLDQFRDGVVTGAGAELAREAAALRAPAPMAPSHVPTPAEHVPVAVVPAPVSAGPATTPAQEEEFPELVSSDAELQSVFLAEADEILQAMDREADAWERAPESTAPLGLLRRAAHTLKGSSRMAGVVGIDLVSQRLEGLLGDVANGNVKVDAQIFARLRNATDGLYRMIEVIRRGGVPDAGPVLAELEGSLPLPEALLAPTVVEMPVAVAPAELTEDEADDEVKAFDPEMAEIFSAEAAELLEQLDTQLTAWQSNPANQAAMLEVQRALHTLKGGARMGGLRAMGSAAHDMETHVNALESGRLPADRIAFTKLRAELEMLQRMHDALRRGETAQLLEPRAAELPPIVEAPVMLPPVEAEVAPTEFSPVEVLVPAGASPWAPLLFWHPDDDRVGGAAALRRETARVPVEQLESMLNQAGEISIYRSRLEQQTTELSRSLKEVEETIARIRDQLRGLNIETEAQIAARGLIDAQAPDRYSGDFDPLEMDRFTRMQELSRAIAESVGDLASLHEAMSQGMGVSETLLLQQGRVNTGVQQGLMGTLMVPFSRQVQRLQRLVRQVAQENGKQADIQFTGIEAELDRNVLERMTAPLEHLLRNAVVHGIETPEQRRSLGKPEVGEIRLSLAREGTQLMMELADDGHGLDFDAIRSVAVERGILSADAQVSDDDAAQLIFQAGFTTTRQLTQDAGRGIGMDVVASEVKQLGGTLELRSELGRGMRLIIRLPLTLALSQALMVSVGNEMYAVPLSSIEGIVRVPLKQLAEHYADEEGKPLLYGNQSYRVRYLGDYLGVPRHEVSERAVGAILFRVAEGLGGQERRVAVVVDVLHGNREIVSKSAGPQISAISGLSGATILPDGRVVLILDVPELVHERARRAAVIATRPVIDKRELILVVDDSITMRRVAERVLGKNGYRIATAKDGLDAMAWLQNEAPAAILLDIEMPRADGFEVAAFVRKNERIKHVPIIMITSRSGEKHRERARSLGVDRYVIKPYQEEQLMTELRSVLSGSGRVH